MALVKMKDLLRRAEEKNIGCGAFSVGNMEMVRGAIRAAEELDTPIILQIAEVRLKNSPLHLMGPMMVQAAKEAKVDVAVHLDHGLTFETVDKALELGFTSVMLDASTLPFEENIARVKAVVEKARKYGATVEAELGLVGGSEGGGIVRSAAALLFLVQLLFQCFQSGCLGFFVFAIQCYEEIVGGDGFQFGAGKTGNLGNVKVQIGAHANQSFLNARDLLQLFGDDHQGNGVIVGVGFDL